MNKTFLWWKFLCMMAVINILFWVAATWKQWEILHSFSPLQAALSGVYVAICAFRSLYLRIDLERYCLFDTPLSSVALGRSCATVAEICFSIQCALVIHDLGTLLASPLIIWISFAIVPIIILAQLFCWYATLTLKHVWHGIEESAWVLMVVLAAGCFYYGLISLTGAHKLLMAIGLVSCAGSAFIMIWLDIPMYFSRSADHLRGNARYLTVNEGLRDAIDRRVQTSDWNIWKKEVVWITTYFTFGVWLSIGMILVDFSA